MNPTYEYDFSSAQQMDPEAAAAAAAVFGVVMLVWLVFCLAIYVYMAICLMKIAKKTGTEPAWLAWIPIANMVLMLMVAKKPIWWIILLFIPLVNIVIGRIVWMKIAKAVGKEEWLGILMIVPIANFIIPGYLAFSKMENQASPVNQVPPVTPVA